jgi:hypothetical protein
MPLKTLKPNLQLLPQSTCAQTLVPALPAPLHRTGFPSLPLQSRTRLNMQHSQHVPLQQSSTETSQSQLALQSIKQLLRQARLLRYTSTPLEIMITSYLATNMSLISRL